MTSSVALTRSDSLTNLPVSMNPRTGLPEDLRDTWSKKSRKVASLHGSHVAEFNNLFKQTKNEQPSGTSICAEPVVLESAPFLLCGNIWTVKVYPFGVDEDSEFLSVKLQNKSEDVINAYYNFSIKRTAKPHPADEQRLNFWVDPDIDRLYFQPEGTEDSAWGVDDFIPLAELRSGRTESGGNSTYMDFYPDDPEPEAEAEAEAEGEVEGAGREGDGKLAAVSGSKADKADKVADADADADADAASVASAQPSVDVPVEFYIFRNAAGERIFDRLYMEVGMMVFGEVSLKAHPLTQAIEGKTPTDEELIAIADTDLNLIKEATKGGGPSLEMVSQIQDTIILTLCPPSSAAEEKNEDKDKVKDKDKADTKRHRPGSSSSSKGGPRTPAPEEKGAHASSPRHKSSHSHAAEAKGAGPGAALSPTPSERK